MIAPAPCLPEVLWPLRPPVLQGLQCQCIGRCLQSHHINVADSQPFQPQRSELEPSEADRAQVNACPLLRLLMRVEAEMLQTLLIRRL
jgi:hypothetical protein